MVYYKKYKCFLVLFLVTFSTLPVFAAKDFTGENITEKKVLVLPFRTENCSEGAGKMLALDLENRLSRAEIFIIVKLTDANSTDCKNRSCGLTIAKNLSADKLITGVLVKKEKEYVSDGNKLYSIEIDVTDVNSGESEISFPAEFDSLEELPAIIEKCAQLIEKVYYGHAQISKAWEVSLAFSTMEPLGDFRNGISFGLGSVMYIYLTKPFWFMAFVGFYGFPPSSYSVKSFVMIPTGINFPYYIPLKFNFTLIPHIGGGVIFSRLNHDYYQYRPLGYYNYKVEYYYNPYASCGLELDYLLYGRMSLAVIPRYYFVFGTDGRRAHLFSADFGVKIYF